MRAVVRSVIGAVVGFVLFALVGILIQHVYYQYMPAKWFLNYYYSKVDNAVVGQPIQLTLCRTIRDADIKLNDTRTFIYWLDSSGRSTQTASSYTFQAHVQKQAGSNCTTVQIPAEKQPRRPGTYVIRTDGEFFVHGQRKVISFETRPYVISDSPASLEERIKALERELNELHSILQASQGSVTSQAGAESANQATQTLSVARPGSSSIVQPNAAPTASQPVTTPAPDPTTPNILTTVTDPLQPALSVLQLLTTRSNAL